MKDQIHLPVIPAKAEIQPFQRPLDSGTASLDTVQNRHNHRKNLTSP